VVEATTFANVKKAIAEDSAEDPMAATFKGGRDGFYFSGTNGRWREVLTASDLVLYEEAKTRVLTPDCARYLEQGEAALLP
jgi:aryl sulfotransferase